MDHLLSELFEQILIRLKVRDLIRCKSVSKTWLSLILDRRFIKAHLKRSYESDHNNKEIEERRIVTSKHPFFNIHQTFVFEHGILYFYEDEYHLIGSSDGLVCVSPSPYQILVVNPSTREVNKLTRPNIPDSESLCWGFGYDASTDDFKVVLGFIIGQIITSFQVFSLKSHMWKVIGETNWVLVSRVGILCKGALHWVAYDASSEKKNVILSFNLSEEKFVEVPQPDDVSYQSRVAQHSSMRLGTINDCLCAFRYELPDDLWVMKDYNVKQSWEIFVPEPKNKVDAVHIMKQLKNYIPNKRPLCCELWYFFPHLLFVGDPIYVESLVSPHFHKRLTRKRRTTNTMRSVKVRAK